MIENSIFQAVIFIQQQNTEQDRTFQPGMHPRKHPQQKDKIVQLKQLVSQPECLKLLILHTPFTLNIQSLHLCTNLVKLDLSKNNLASFPYLGELTSLKFMLIHDNKLDIDGLIGIFQEDVGRETRSPLSKAIVWVTYWGNKSEFNARHYLINHTSVLAVDHHMAVPEEKSQAIFTNKKLVQPFDPVTNISDILQNRRKFNKNATEEEYMAQFWQDMAEIRRRYEKINGVVKIQKVYRGWSYRLKQQRQKEEKQNNKVVVKNVFEAWKRWGKFNRKLKLIFKKYNKEYLLLPLKQMRLQAAKRKIVEYVQAMKKKVILRKMSLRSEYKFYNVLKSNQQALKSLYNILHVDRSSYVMVHVEGIEQFKKYVIPVASCMNGNIDIKLEKNENIGVRSLYQPPRKRREFLRLIQVNQKSLVSEYRPKKDKIVYNYTVYKVQTNLSASYVNNVHFSQTQKQKMENIDKSLKYKKNMDLNQLRKVSGQKQLLRDIVRGVYFYNMGYLTNCQAPALKINILSQFSIKKMSAILKIQKVWRGISLRRKIMKVAKQNYKKSRAAIKIQRWFRNLPRNHRRIFMFDACKALKSFNSQYFYVKTSQYLQIVNKAKNDDGWRFSKLSFPQQNVMPFINLQSKRLLISWDNEAPNQGSFINSRLGRTLFTKQFLHKIFDKWDFLSPIKLGEEKNYQRCQISHLFHYRTQVSLITRKNGKYMQINCGSKYECRLRVLCLKLLSYRFNHKEILTILPKQSINFYQAELNFKKEIKNPNSIFISQTDSSFQIEAINNQNTKTFQLYSKFYLNGEANQKPVKFSTTLKILFIDFEQKEKEKEEAKRIRSMSQHEKFDISSFLIAQTNQIRLDQNRPINLNHQLPLSSKIKDSIKNLKHQKRLKMKNREKVHSMHTSQTKQKQKYNFMLGDPHHQQRLTTQPDLLTHERSMGSIVVDLETNKKDVGKVEGDFIQSRVKVRKRLAMNGEAKNQAKNVEEFTKNFINQGNFIQNQFLYGQIKRMKTEIQRNSVDQAARIKTEQNEKTKVLQKFKEQKLRRAHLSHQKHKQQQFKSVIEKRTGLQQKIKQKSETKQLQANYRSVPRKMRINFAEECYPIIGKYPPIASNAKKEQ